MRPSLALCLAMGAAAAACASPQSKLTESQEYYAGRAVSATLLARYPPCEDPELTEYVSLVGHSIALASDRPETFRGYVFGVLDGDEPNAFAAPSGFVFLTLGLLRLCKTEDELAGVLAHEIAHVNLKHPELAVAKAKADAEGARGFTSLIPDVGIRVGGVSVDPSFLRELFGKIVDGVVDALITKGYERGQELEADLKGAEFMAREDVGYNPWALVDVLKRLATASERAYGWTGGTHPKPADRAARLERHLTEGSVGGRTDPARTARFDEKTRKIRR